MSGPIRSLREARSGEPPLVFVHPISGDARAYASLAQRLEQAGAVLGIDARGLAGEAAPRDSLAEMAAAYLAALRARGGGPWRLAGWSIGGVIAAEMAAQLAEAGEPPSFLALLDCRAPVPEMRARPAGERDMARRFVLVTAYVAGREPSREPESADPAELLALLAADGLAPPGWDEAEVARRLAVFAANLRALFGHPQRRVPVPVHLFESEAEHPRHPKPATLGWEAHAAVVRRARVPGTHFTLLAEAHVPRLAAALDLALRAAGG
jgi:thioesterase domain-containing protein